MLARLREVLTAHVLAEGPADQPDRLRSLDKAIAWSYRLLSPAEQQLFRRLSIFVGGFSLDAVSTMVPGEPPAPAIRLPPGFTPPSTRGCTMAET